MLRLILKIFRRISLFNKRTSLKWFLIKNRALYPNRFSVDSSFNVGNFFSLVFDASDSSVSIGEQVQFRDFCQIRSGENSTLKIGDRVFFNNYCTINCLMLIEIGSDNQFGENVKFYDANHEYRSKTEKISMQGNTYGKIKIGNNCWIGSNVCLLKDITIGDNVIIGAGCTVHQSVASNTILINKQQLVIKSYN